MFGSFLKFENHSHFCNLDIIAPRRWFVKGDGGKSMGEVGFFRVYVAGCTPVTCRKFLKP
jgi:hypothetical protein